MIHILDVTCQTQSQKQADVPMEEEDALNWMSLKKLEIYSKGNKLGDLRNKEVKARCNKNSENGNKSVLIQNGMNVNENVTENLNIIDCSKEITLDPRMTKLEKRVDEIEKKSNSVLQVNCLILAVFNHVLI